MNIGLEGKQAEQLSLYVSLVSSWNEIHNLTAARTTQDLLEILLVDGIVLGKLKRRLGVSVVDVGSGAGAPAIPWLLTRENLNVTLVERTEKKVSVLEDVLDALSLGSRCSVLSHNATSSSPLAADVACARATLPPEEWVELGCHFAPCVLTFTAEEPEIDTSALEVHRLWTERYQLPWSEKTRQICAFGRTRAWKRMNERGARGARRPSRPRRIS